MSIWPVLKAMCYLQWMNPKSSCFYYCYIAYIYVLFFILSISHCCRVTQDLWQHFPQHWMPCTIQAPNQWFLSALCDICCSWHWK
jgi:hypothetical protein